MEGKLTRSPTPAGAPALAAVDHERLAGAVTTLAARVREPDVAAQLHALSGILRNLDAERPPADEVDRLGQEIAAAMRAGDEAGAIASARQLARLERAGVRPVDWTASSRG
jgi:hypothetical protein